MEALKRQTLWFVCKLISLLPFGVLYVFSDMARFLLFYVVKYRRKVVLRNLEASFPDKSAKEIHRIAYEFYRFFGDYVVETLKILSLSPDEMRHRMQMVGTDSIERTLQTHDYVFVMLGHYGNWEWISSLPLWIKSPDVACAQIYRPLKDAATDTLFYDLRTRFGSVNINKYEVLRHILRIRNGGKKVVVGFISDQSPSLANIHDWVTFLNQETGVFTGAERIGKRLNAAFYFADVKRLRRGCYQVHYRLMTDKAQDEPDYAITEAYMNLLEAMIRKSPELWLWSHKRWKVKRPQVQD